MLFENYFRTSSHTTVEYNYIRSILCFAFLALELSFVILGYLQSDIRTMLLDHSTEIDLQLAEEWKPSSTSQLLTKQNSSPGTSNKQ